MVKSPNKVLLRSCWKRMVCSRPCGLSTTSKCLLLLALIPPPLDMMSKLLMQRQFQALLLLPSLLVLPPLLSRQLRLSVPRLPRSMQSPSHRPFLRRITMILSPSQFRMPKWSTLLLHLLHSPLQTMIRPPKRQLLFRFPPQMTPTLSRRIRALRSQGTSTVPRSRSTRPRRRRAPARQIPLAPPSRSRRMASASGYRHKTSNALPAGSR